MVTTTEIADSLRAAGGRLEAAVASTGWNKDLPLIQSGGWNLPGYSITMVLQELERIAYRIQHLDGQRLQDKELQDYLAKLSPLFAQLNFANVGSDPDAVIGTFPVLLGMIDRRIPYPVQPKPKVDWEDIKNTDLIPRDLKRRLKSVASRLEELEPNAGVLAQKIADIEAAHEAAEQLPTDMLELSAHRETMKSTTEQATKQAIAINAAEDETKQALTRLAETERQAAALVGKAEEAYRVTTSKGLAGAFQERATGLAITGWIWVGGLVVALLGALYIGAERVESLKDVLTGDKSATVVWVNALLAALGIGAPIWLAWLATRQIGQCFKLAEDYSYKASVAKAYEGYRREAVSLDPALAARLFSSALTRLEEAPIRLIEEDQHNTPLQEFLGSPQVTALLAEMPDIKNKLIALIPGKGEVAAIAVAPLAAVAGATSARSESEL